MEFWKFHLRVTLNEHFNFGLCLIIKTNLISKFYSYTYLHRSILMFSILYRLKVTTVLHTLQTYNKLVDRMLYINICWVNRTYYLTFLFPIVIVINVGNLLLKVFHLSLFSHQQDYVRSKVTFSCFGQRNFVLLKWFM